MNKKNEVIIYTSALCGFCYKAKSLLKKKNIFFHEINVDLDYNKKEEMIKRTNGRTSVPQIFLEIIMLEDAMIYSNLRRIVI